MISQHRNMKNIHWDKSLLEKQDHWQLKEKNCGTQTKDDFKKSWILLKKKKNIEKKIFFRMSEE